MVRTELLEFLNCMQNEIMMASIDPEESVLGEHPKIIANFKMVVAVIERIFPMLQVTDELVTGDITPALFYMKWKKAIFHFNDTIEDDDIGEDVANLLTKF